ncbi:MAG: acetate--CoA ligase family protein [Methanomassiliicoccales archaeon]|nr:acetate--CoA ligase family protein [Methanomassiliicoccales archaeon]
MDLDAIRSSGRMVLTEAEVKTLLREKGIATTSFVTPTREELDSLDIHFPVAVKVCSADIMHKSDVGGVYLNVHDRREMVESYEEIKSRFPEAEVLVEPMVAKGFEVIVGVADDPTFGQCIMFGSGGVLANLIQDVSFRKTPIAREDALEMIAETKARSVFEGVRGMKAELVSAVDMLLRVSDLATEMDGRLDQLDLNPVVLGAEGCIAVDAKMILK